MVRPAVALKLGLFAPTIGEQLAKQGLQAERAEDAAQWQSDREAIKRLEVRGILTDTEALLARHRLHREIGRNIEPLTEEGRP